MIDEVLPAALDGERLDRVVAMLGDCSRSAAAGLIAEGSVRLDSRVVTQRSARVEQGQRVEFEPVTSTVASPQPDSDVEFTIVHVDDELVVIDKPPGLVVHPGAGRAEGTLVNGLLARFPILADVGNPIRPGIVHRLDAETSGLLVVARTDRAASVLVDRLRHHDIERSYLAVVNGAMVDQTGVIDAPIGRSGRQRTKMAVVPDGKPARTHYEVLDRTVDGAATLARCALETGRTHQIRVHLAAIGHPVVGDQVYGSKTHPFSIGRVALHATRLAFVHPVTDEPMVFEVEPPPDFAGLCRELGLTV